MRTTFACAIALMLTGCSSFGPAAKTAADVVSSPEFREAARHAVPALLKMARQRDRVIDPDQTACFPVSAMIEDVTDDVVLDYEVLMCVARHRD